MLPRTALEQWNGSPLASSPRTGIQLSCSSQFFLDTNIILYFKKNIPPQLVFFPRFGVGALSASLLGIIDRHLAVCSSMRSQLQHFNSTNPQGLESSRAYFHDSLPRLMYILANSGSTLSFISACCFTFLEVHPAASPQRGPFNPLYELPYKSLCMSPSTPSASHLPAEKKG